MNQTLWELDQLGIGFTTEAEGHESQPIKDYSRMPCNYCGASVKLTYNDYGGHLKACEAWKKFRELERQHVQRKVEDELFPMNEVPPPFRSPILAEADSLVFGDRQAAYGHPSSDFRAMGRIAGAIIGRWLESEGYDLIDKDKALVEFPAIPTRIVPLIQQAVKLSRESAQHKRDNAVDGAGYWACLDRIVEDY